MSFPNFFIICILSITSNLWAMEITSEELLLESLEAISCGKDYVDANDMVFLAQFNSYRLLVKLLDRSSFENVLKKYPDFFHALLEFIKSKQECAKSKNDWCLAVCRLSGLRTKFKAKYEPHIRQEQPTFSAKPSFFIDTANPKNPYLDFNF